MPSWRAEPVTVAGGGGTPLATYARGPAGAPGVLLVHGIAQSSRAWAGVFAGPLADALRLVAVDLRGHGRSGRPADGYADPATWAEDVRAVIDAHGLDRPVVVAWSYGGLVLCDHLRVCGDGQVGGCLFVGASTRINDRSAPPTVGAAMLEAGRALLDDDAGVRARGAAAFVRRMRGGAVDPGTLAAMAEDVLAVPVAVLRALLTRRAVNDDVLGSLSVPVTVLHGAGDPLVLPAMAERTAAAVPGARLVVLPGRGHSVFAEDPEAFGAEVRALVRAASLHGGQGASRMLR